MIPKPQNNVPIESQTYPGAFEVQLLEKNAVKNGNDDEPGISFAEEERLTSYIHEKMQ